MKKKVEEILDVLKHAITKYYADRLISAALFGSYARGTATPDSDIDILIIAEPLPNGRMCRIQEFETVELDAEHTMSKMLQLSPVIKTKMEINMGSPLLWDMVDYHRILYDNGDFFKKILLSVKKRLADLEAPELVRTELQPCASISKRLRKERELSFYGDIDFIPTEEYSKDDALQTIQDVKTVVTLALKVIPLF